MRGASPTRAPPAGSRGSPRSRSYASIERIPQSDLTRRDLLERAGFVGAAALLAGLPDLARLEGWLDEAHAATPADVRQTFEGLVAYVVPGPDRYSRQQGQRHRAPGGVASGGADVLIATLDRFIVTRPPFSAAVAAFLDGLSPPSGGPFRSRFANVRFQEKRAVLDALRNSSEEGIRFLGANLAGLAAFACYSEANAYDRRRRRLRKRPLGWRITGYDGLAEGRAELKGYYRGRRRADA